jgi:hypothetical protein
VHAVGLALVARQHRLGRECLVLAHGLVADVGLERLFKVLAATRGIRTLHRRGAGRSKDPDTPKHAAALMDESAGVLIGTDILAIVHPVIPSFNVAQIAVQNVIRFILALLAGRRGFAAGHAQHAGDVGHGVEVMDGRVGGVEILAIVAAAILARRSAIRLQVGVLANDRGVGAFPLRGEEKGVVPGGRGEERGLNVRRSGQVISSEGLVFKTKGLTKRGTTEGGELVPEPDSVEQRNQRSRAKQGMTVMERSRTEQSKKNKFSW